MLGSGNLVDSFDAKPNLTLTATITATAADTTQIVSTSRLDSHCVRDVADSAFLVKGLELSPTTSSTSGGDVSYATSGPERATAFALRISKSLGQLGLCIFLHLRSQNGCIQLGRILCMIALWSICLVIVMQNLQAGVIFSRHLEQREKRMKNGCRRSAYLGRIKISKNKFRKRERERERDLIISSIPYRSVSPSNFPTFFAVPLFLQKKKILSCPFFQLNVGRSKHDFLTHETISILRVSKLSIVYSS